jgi:serine/threonine protein kinase
MAADGPKKSHIIKDNNGNIFHFSEADVLGRGAGGTVYRGEVVDVGHGQSGLAVGQEVALKILKSSTDLSNTNIQRELELQKREGTLYTTITQSEGGRDAGIILVQPIYPGVDLRNALYLHSGPEGNAVPVAFKPISNEQANSLLEKLENDELTVEDKDEIARRIAGDVECRIMNHIRLYEISDIENNIDALRSIVKTFAPKLNNNAREKIAANFLRMQPLLIALKKETRDDNDKALIRKQIRDNTALTNVERDSIAYSLIRDYFAIQQLGIVHCDIKPDNILIDRQSRTAKIIDMGQAFLMSNNPHNEFQGPGIMYSAPEASSVNRETTSNSILTDLYGLGIIIASMYSANAYEVGVRDVANSQLASRVVLSDVLDAENVPGMPGDLLQIVKHISQINPEKRPPNIALANGVNGSKELSGIHQLQQESMLFTHKVLSEHILSLNSRFPDEIKLLSRNADLPTILQTLHTMKSKSANSPKTYKALTRAIDLIEEYHHSHVRNMQQSRIEAIQGHVKEELSSTGHIVAQLIHEASKYRIRQEGGFLGIMSKQQGDFRPEGQILNTAVRDIKQLTTHDSSKIIAILTIAIREINKIPTHSNDKERNNLIALLEGYKNDLKMRLELASGPSQPNAKKVRFSD